MESYLPSFLTKFYHHITNYEKEIADPVQRIRAEMQAKTLFGVFLTLSIAGFIEILCMNASTTANSTYVILIITQIYCAVSFTRLYYKKPQFLGIIMSVYTMVILYLGTNYDETLTFCGLVFSITMPNFILFLTQSNRMAFFGLIYSITLNLITGPKFYSLIVRESGSQYLANLLDAGRATFNVYAIYDFAFSALGESRSNKILSELAVTLKNEEHMKQEKELLHAKSLFFSCFSHEMRNPLNCILGSMDYAIKYAVDDTVRDILATGKASGSMLLNLINNILDMGKIESHNICLNEDTKDSKVFITNIWRVTQEMFKKKKLQGEIFVDRDFPANITIDDSRLTQVIVNLISNACKFTEEGKSIRIIVSFIRDNVIPFQSIHSPLSTALKFNRYPLAQEIGPSPSNNRPVKKIMPNQFEPQLIDEVLDSQEDEQLGSSHREMLASIPMTKSLHHVKTKSQAVANKYVMLFSTNRSATHRVDWNPQYDSAHSHQQGVINIEVIDTGCGMTPEEVSKVFKPFTQTKKTFSEIYQGTGLGLYITKSLVDLMKGTIKVDSQPGIGSNFSIRIPNSPSLVNIESDSNNGHLNIQSQFSRFKILITSGDETLEASGDLAEALDKGLFSEYRLERTNKMQSPNAINPSDNHVAVYYIYDIATLRAPDVEKLKTFTHKNRQEFIFLYCSEDNFLQRSTLSLDSQIKVFFDLETLTNAIQSQTKDLLSTIKSKYTLLIVDDDTFNLKILSLFLTKEGYKVYTAQNGQLGFEVYCSHPDEIDMVILDYDMPVCDGPTCCEMILKFMSQNRLDPVPIYALTGNVSQESKVRMHAAGIQKTWFKPAKMEEIMSEVFHLLSRKKK